ncbi:MAG: signal peptidase II [Paludibacteraceae bacterium]|nr:signal peptidase II [Paludibacteraceae bacterium]
MKKEVKQGILVAGIVVLALFLDQWLKLWIATHFSLGESVRITSWFWLCFVENDGMAFGIEWFSKFVLTLFRIVAVGVLCWYMWRLIHINKARTSYLATIALVTAGAMGNIIDCVFYGKLFGYAGWFYGKVVDMLYFPLITNSAGECIFFRPVFNLADSCITVAVILILIFFRKDLDTSLKKVENEKQSGCQK